MDQVDEVKQKSDITQVVGSYVDLKKAGRNYKGLCPFHQEKTPSFMVSPELQIFKCFGCGESGDVIAFLQKYEHMDFYEALKFLADKVGIKLAPISPKFGENDRLYLLNRAAANFYKYVLLSHSSGKKALAYLTRERGIRIDTIKKFNLGFSPDKPQVLVNYLIKKKKFSQDELIKGGLVYRRGPHLIDRFTRRIVFPIHDHRGNIVGFAGRVLPDDKTEMGKYINSPETAVYHKSRSLYGLNFSKNDIKSAGSAVVVEGEMDFISAYQAGVRNIVAIKGTAFTQEQVSLLSRFTQKLVLALDSDFAGSVAARRGITLAQDAGFDLYVANLGEYKDPDELARHDPEKLLKAISDAKGVWDYLVGDVLKKHDPSTGVGKSHISREIAPVLTSIPDEIVRAHYIEVVARRLRVPSAAVYDRLNKVKETYSDKSEKKVRPPEKDRRYGLEERLILIILHSDIALLDKHKSLFKNRVFGKIIDEYQAFIDKYKKFDTSKFSKQLPAEVFESYSDLVLKEVEDSDTDQSKLEKELALVKLKIMEMDLKEKLTQLARDIKTFEGEKEKNKLKDAQENFAKISRQLMKLESGDDSGIILN
jgi:DNA primase